MRVLVVGGGGREHALAWRLRQSAGVTAVFVAPGNAGTAREPGLENVPIAADAVAELVAFATTEQIDLTVVGPEAPLVQGIRDAFDAAGLKCFGPTAAAAQLEGSKAFAKAFLERHNIPTARYAVFTETAAALAYVREQGAPIVVKADGLAAGKGVVVAETLAQAEAAIVERLPAGGDGKVVIEEFLSGEEASYICLCDGTHAVPFASSQDHKRLLDGDEGPNTGGMGAYSPAPVLTPEVDALVLREIVEPTLAGMRADGMPYQGFLYVGLMITADGAPKVIEYNCRFGDPEAQPIMVRLRSDLAALCEQALTGSVRELILDWDPRPALAVVLAAANYPGAPATGDPIEGLDTAPLKDSFVFHAGTRLEGDAVVTSGGRVLATVGLGEGLKQARDTAYAQADRISWPGCQRRSDIGYRALG
ncbi:MAG: phosphoribosylamine--glycine ligase [Pseudomonadota bacterium]